MSFRIVLISFLTLLSACYSASTERLQQGVAEIETEELIAYGGKPRNLKIEIITVSETSFNKIYLKECTKLLAYQADIGKAPTFDPLRYTDAFDDDSLLFQVYYKHLNVDSLVSLFSEAAKSAQTRPDIYKVRFIVSAEVGSRQIRNRETLYLTRKSLKKINPFYAKEFIL